MDITSKIKKELQNVLTKLNIAEQINYVVEIPKDNTNGDYATNIAMQLTRVLRKNPRMIATDIVNAFDSESCDIDRIEIAGPGFINFFVKSTSFAPLIKHVLESGDNYGKQTHGQGKKYKKGYCKILWFCNSLIFCMVKLVLQLNAIMQ